MAAAHPVDPLANASSAEARGGVFALWLRRLATAELERRRLRAFREPHDGASVA